MSDTVILKSAGRARQLGNQSSWKPYFQLNVAGKNYVCEHFKQNI